MNNGLVSFTLFVHVSKQLHPSRRSNFVNIAISDSRFWFQEDVIGMYGLRKLNIFGVVIWVTKVIPPGCSKKEWQYRNFKFLHSLKLNCSFNLQYRYYLPSIISFVKSRAHLFYVWWPSLHFRYELVMRFGWTISQSIQSFIFSDSFLRRVLVVVKIVYL